MLARLRFVVPDVLPCATALSPLHALIERHVMSAAVYTGTTRRRRSWRRAGPTPVGPGSMSAMTVPSVATIRRQYCSGRPMTARAIKVEQLSMAQLLARMERDGLIRRAPARDRRSSLIALTDKARAKLPAGRGILEAGNREAMSGLSDEEVAP